MRRADRLFQIVQFLRRRRVTRAAWLAERLEVSERTIYRDIQALIASGLPIEGEAGVGYSLPRRIELPPLGFTRVELEAMVLGTRALEAWGDPELAESAAAAVSRLESVLPELLQGVIDRTPLFAPRLHVPASSAELLAPLRRAIDERRKVQLRYRCEDGSVSTRQVRPLGLSLLGGQWSLVGWCEQEESFRHFRLERVAALEPSSERFQDGSDARLADLLHAALPPA